MKKLIILILALLVIPIQVSMAQTQPPGFVLGGNAFKTGDHSAFAFKAGFHALESVKTDSVTGEKTGALFVRVAYWKTEDVTVVDHLNDLQAFGASIIREVQVSDLFSVALGGGFAYQPKEGEDEVDFPILLEGGLTFGDRVKFILGCEYWTLKDEGDIVIPYAGVALDLF